MTVTLEKRNRISLTFSTLFAHLDSYLYKMRSLWIILTVLVLLLAVILVGSQSGAIDKFTFAKTKQTKALVDSVQWGISVDASSKDYLIKVYYSFTVEGGYVWLKKN